jgi:hypothetical protein
MLVRLTYFPFVVNFPLIFESIKFDGWPKSRRSDEAICSVA